MQKEFGVKFCCELPIINSERDDSISRGKFWRRKRLIENILLVEDQPSIRHLLNSWLTESGYKVTTAKDGNEALKAIQNDSSLHLVISDILMQNMDGLDMPQKCHEISPNLPVVLMSGYTRDENIIEALRSGACDYLVKPFEKHQLLSVIQRAEYLPSAKNKSTNKST